MEYGKYKQSSKTKEEFFSEWKTEELARLPSKVRDEIYQEHMFYFTVYNRDNFTCQHKVKTEVGDKIVYEPCPYCNNVKYFENLTLHHIRHKRNFKDKEGRYITTPHKPRNGVIVCQGSHNAFNKNKIGLTFDKDSNCVPHHIRGHSLWLHKKDKINWKEKRAENAEIRTTIKNSLPKSIKELPIGKRTWFVLEFGEICILFIWLTIPYYELIK